MGLVFLPWERLPAYILGPFLCALNILLLFIDDRSTVWGWILKLCVLAFGIWIIWYRYTTGKEPFTKDKTVNTIVDRNDNEEK